MFLLENLVAVLMWALITVGAVNFVFLCFVFYRRLARSRYYHAKDSARSRYADVIQRALRQKDADAALALLHTASSGAERDLLREQLLTHCSGAEAERATELLFQLDYVDGLARRAFGRRRGKRLLHDAREGAPVTWKFDPRRSWLDPLLRMKMFAVPRALAVDSLGRLAPRMAQVFIAEALNDPATDVRRVAIYAMGNNTAAIPFLLEELRRAIEEHNDVSLRSAKATLVRYRLADIQPFLTYLQHRHRRVRFFAVDIIREICNLEARAILLNKNDFSREMYDVFLEKLVVDEFPDVRARSAAVIRHFHDDRATRALRALLRDDNEFVRLHAVRACADSQYSSLAPVLVSLLNDTKWRVREAAAHSLLAFGRSGINELYRAFVMSTDQYASEQMAEEIQRGGFTQDLVAVLSSSNDDSRLAQAVCGKLVILGKMSLLTRATASEGVPASSRMLLMDLLGNSPSEQFLAALEKLASRGEGELGKKANSILTKLNAKSASAGRN